MTNEWSAFSWLKIGIYMGLIIIFSLAVLLWVNTPDLFEYFNMAFCAH
ncbi:hypothetical protein ACG94X_06425 [Acinetobacter sp. ULE_I010]